MRNARHAVQRWCSLMSGLLVALAECRACGHREIWNGASPDATGGDDW